jgi:hypothetical protein
MREIGGIPIVRKITSIKNLSPGEQRRLKRLKEIFTKEGRSPLGTSMQEMKYLFRFEARRKSYQRRRHLFRFTQRRTPEKKKELKELWETLESAYPPWETFEEELEPLSERRPEQNEVSEK